MQRISHSYFVVMEDLGRHGLEATVHPENTRRKVVELIAKGQYGHIVFIHHVDDLVIEDVTLELMDEAEAQACTATFDQRADRIAAEHDHARDLAKHEVF
jgi:predicted nucleic acid-binding protein